MPEITLLLHNIRSTYNVGSIFRSAEGFGVKRIILTGYTPYPSYAGDTRLPHLAEKITNQIRKTALGAEAMVPFTYYETVNEFIENNSLPLVGLEQASNSVNLRDFTSPAALALVVGEEVHGIEPYLLDKCSVTLEIPMRGAKESFNVSVATGIALYQLTASCSAAK